MKTKKLLSTILATSLILISLSGCTSTAATSTPKATATTKQNVTLNIYNWGDYLNPEVVEAFEAEYPYIKIQETYFDSNEAMLAKLKADSSTFDIVIPSDYAITRMIKDDMLAEIDLTKITNYSGILDYCKNQSFDPGNKYSIPYMWGTVGILYNTKMVKETVDSWSILFNTKYKKKIIMYDSVRDCMLVALKKLGYSCNTKDEAQLEAAKNLLVSQKPLVLSYGTDEIKRKMISNEAALAVVYSGDAILAMDENENLNYVVPKEGSNVWFDNIAILKNSQHKEEAELFINFLLRPDIAAKNSEYIGYTSPVKEAIELLGEGYADNPAYNPSQDIIKRCEIYGDLGDYMQKYNEIWIQIKSS